MIDRPLMNYYGGKFRIAPWILENFPPHSVYVEVFGGALSVFMQKRRAHTEVVNDIDYRIVNVYRAVRNYITNLSALMEMTPYSRMEYEEAKIRSEDPIEDARRVITSSYMGVGNSVTEGNTNGFRNSKSSFSPSHSWRNYLETFDQFHERLSGVIVENLSWEDCFAKYDAPNTLFYLDPPYVAATRSEQHRNRGYTFEMTDEDHYRLVHEVKKLTGMVVLSGYDNPIYQFPGWRRLDKEARTQRGGTRIETLWVNPAATAACAQQEMFRGEK